MGLLSIVTRVDRRNNVSSEQWLHAKQQCYKREIGRSGQKQPSHSNQGCTRHANKHRYWKLWSWGQWIIIARHGSTRCVFKYLYILELHSNSLPQSSKYDRSIMAILSRLICRFYASEISSRILITLNLTELSKNYKT